ncbi:tRNA 2-selenouridine(34) synthase MnmH [Virgibacillus byunsanensis]|uniref:tRNA 2-selenouridine(34) synthase MnmH n=1 Tax=Virgibacillus byunsanensis TaxID=570945 RepID=A0ABW3LGX4_9BACI
MFEDITIDELRSLKDTGELTVVDVRSPSEFKNSTIPGSINIPFFSDEERAEVGTIYKQVSKQAAKDRGLEIVSAKLPNFVREFANLDGKKAVFCWRGGMRSRTSATVLALMGIKVFRLDGGFRSYRNWVVDTLETTELKPDAFVLNGYTGSGKTAILHRLREENYPVLDFEGMANHRGSIFGQIGLEPHNQKTFDALLIENMQHLKHSPYVLMEGESRRIGKVIIPDFILDKKENGTQLFIDIPIEERVTQILDEYQPWNHEQACFEAFRRIRRRIHTPISNQIDADLKAGNYDSAVRLLLEHYYDPLYDHSIEQIPEDKKITIKASTVDKAVELLRDYLGVRQENRLG